MRRSTLLLVAALFIVSIDFPTIYAQDRTTQASKAKNTVYLADMKPSSMNSRSVDKDYLASHWSTGVAHMDGREWPHTVVLTNGGFIETEMSAVFLINRQYDWFDATIGVSDKQSNHSMNYQFVVSSLGKTLYRSEQMAVGDKPVNIHLPVKDVVGLTLSVFASSNYDYIYACWSDAKLVKGNSPPPNPITQDPMPQPEDDLHPPIPQPMGETFSFETRDVDELAKKLKAQVEDDKEQFKTRPVSVAIALFDLIPKTLSSDNARKLREQLNVALTKTKTFRVVERGQLDKILEELKRSKSDITDPKTAQGIGKQVNARNVLIGSISDEKTYVQVNVRMINTETGESSIAESVEVKKH